MPVDLSTVTLPRLPYLDELARIVTGQAAEHHQWPPPGMARLIPLGSLSYALTGVADGPGWWWSTAQEINPAITGVEQALSAARYVGLEVSAAIRAAVEALGWVPLVYEKGNTMDWIKVGIHGQLGTSEQIIHTVSLTAGGSTPAALPDDGAGLRAVCTEVATAWASIFPLVKGPSIVPFKNWLGPYVRYDAVTATVLRQTEPSPKVYTKGQPNLITSVVPTERVNFPTPWPAGESPMDALPFEVACAVTLLTRAAGARNRGRMYLGGLAVSTIGSTEGLFKAEAAATMGYAVGHFIEAIRTDTPWQVSIVSRRSLLSHEVVRTATGQVPDSQRRRRGAQVENRINNWESPTI